MVLETEARNKGWVWGPYPNYDDISRFQYGRMMWRGSGVGQRRFEHLAGGRGPYKGRVLERRGGSGGEIGPPPPAGGKRGKAEEQRAGLGLPEPRNPPRVS